MLRVSASSRKVGSGVATRIQQVKTWQDSGGMAGIQPNVKPKGKSAA